MEKSGVGFAAHRTSSATRTPVPPNAVVGHDGSVPYNSGW